MDLLTLIVIVLATMRVVRLLRWDTITAPVRAWSIDRFGVSGKLPYLLHCHRCLSVWVAIPPAVACVLWPTNRVLWATLLALAISEAALLIHDRTEAGGR